MGNDGQCLMGNDGLKIARWAMMGNDGQCMMGNDGAMMGNDGLMIA
jgi:hypothetical protein